MLTQPSGERKPYFSMNILSSPPSTVIPCDLKFKKPFSPADTSFRSRQLFSNATALMVSIIETRPLALVGERFSLRPI